MFPILRSSGEGAASKYFKALITFLNHTPVMRHYCTYFDHNYLARGLALHASLARQGGAFKLHVLCLSETCHRALRHLALPEIVPIALADFERGDALLLAAKANRSLIEYYFTCTPSLPRYVFNQFPEVDGVTYLDSDLYFFADPELVFAEIGDASIAITPHRFPPALKDEERHGLYNVGWLTFRRDAEGLSCMELWRAQCLEWCYDRFENGRYADQKYLDAWPERFRSVKILSHPGVNAAPWNLAGSQFTNGQNGVEVNGKPLIFFHFHGLKRLFPLIYDSHWASYQVRPNAVLRHNIYAPYLKELERCKRETAPLTVGAATANIRTAKGPARSKVRQAWRNSRLRRFLHGMRAWWGMLRGRHFLVWNGRLLR